MKRNDPTETDSHKSLRALISAALTNNISHFLDRLNMFISYYPVEQLSKLFSDLSAYSEKLGRYKVVSTLQVIRPGTQSSLAAFYFEHHLDELRTAFTENVWARQYLINIPTAPAPSPLAANFGEKIRLLKGSYTVTTILNAALSPSFLTSKKKLSKVYEMLFHTNDHQQIFEACLHYLATGTDIELLKAYWKAVCTRASSYLLTTEDASLLKQVLIGLGHNPRVSEIIPNNYLDAYQLVKPSTDPDKLTILSVQTLLALGIDISAIVKKELTGLRWERAIQNLLECGWQPYAFLSELWDRQQRDFNRIVRKFYNAKVPVELVVEACVDNRGDKVADYLNDSQDSSTYHATIRFLRANNWYALAYDLDQQLTGVTAYRAGSASVDRHTQLIKGVFHVLLDRLPQQDKANCIMASPLIAYPAKKSREVFHVYLLSERKKLLEDISKLIQKLSSLEKQIWRPQPSMYAYTGISTILTMACLAFSSLEAVCYAKVTCSTDVANKLIFSAPEYCVNGSDIFDVDNSITCSNFSNQHEADAHGQSIYSPQRLMETYAIFAFLAAGALGVMNYLLWASMSPRLRLINHRSFLKANGDRLFVQAQEMTTQIQRHQAVLAVNEAYGSKELTSAIASALQKLETLRWVLSPSPQPQDGYTSLLSDFKLDDPTLIQALTQYRNKLSTLPTTEWEQIFTHIGYSEPTETEEAQTTKKKSKSKIFTLWRKKEEEQPLLANPPAASLRTLEAGAGTDSDDEDQIRVAPISPRTLSRGGYGAEY